MAVGRILCWILCPALLLAGCRSAPRPHVSFSTQRLAPADPFGHVDVRSPAESPEVPAHLEGPHPVETYIEVALGRNAELQAARMRMEALSLRVPVATQIPDPMLGMTVFPEPVQTAAGQQELLLSASQKLPWFGKRGTRGGMAVSEANAARAELAAAELATTAKVKRAYYELYYVQKALQITDADEQLLVEIRDIASTRYETGQTSQQDVLRAELELSQVEAERLRLRQQLETAQARLARLLRVAPQTRLRALDELPPEEVPRDLAQLQQLAVAARPELHAQLASLERDRQAVALAALDFMPDVTFGVTWIDVASAGLSRVANGRDAFLLTAGVNLPLDRHRLGAAVRSAEAKAVATARSYDALRDATLEEVTDLFAQARSQQELLILFREDILPRARQTLEVSSRAYSVGEVDFLQMIDNWRQLLRYETGHLRLEASLRQSLAELQRVVGGMERRALETVPVPQPDPAAHP